MAAPPRARCPQPPSQKGLYPVKGGGTACTRFQRFTSVRPPYYPSALVATTERPCTEQWMAPKGRERSNHDLLPTTT
eukprot:4062647-Prymnesium_polylepis.1